MGRILLSNNSEVFENMVQDYSRCFQLNGCSRSEGLYVAAFKKLRGNSVNFKEWKEGCIAVTGTFLYKNEHGASALDKFYRDFREDLIGALTRKAMGCYAVVVKKGGVVHVLVDNSGAYKLYYYYGGGRLVVSNSLYHMARNIRDGLSINGLALLEGSFQFSILGEDTPFNEIRQITGRMVLEYQVKSHTVRELPKQLTPCDPVLSDGNIDDAAKHLAGIIRHTMDVVTRPYDRVTLHLTGGLDSRLVLASMLSIGRKPKIVYGVGNSPLTNTRVRDLEIVNIYSRTFGLDLYQMDWTAQNNFMEDWDRLLDKYGEAYGIYSGLNTVFREYEENLPEFTEFVEYGQQGETLRNVASLEWCKGSSLSLGALIERVYLYEYDRLRQCVRPFEQYREYIHQKLYKVCGELGIDARRIGKDEFQRIHNRYREKADTRMVNLQNAIVYSTVILADQEVQGYLITIPYEWKRRARFQLRVINELFPDVLDVPVFSHCRDWRYDRDKGELREINRYMHVKAYIEGRIRRSRVGPVCRAVKTGLLANTKERKGVVQGPKGVRTTLRAGVARLQAKMGLNLMQAESYEGDIRGLMLYYQNLYWIDKAVS